MLEKIQNIRILRIVPNLKAENTSLNSIFVTFDFQGKMICELEILLASSTEPPLLYQSNLFVTTIEKVCATKDRQQLFEAYNNALIAHTKNGTASYSNLNDMALFSAGDDAAGNESAAESTENKVLVEDSQPFKEKLRDLNENFSVHLS